MKITRSKTRCLFRMRSVVLAALVLGTVFWEEQPAPAQAPRTSAPAPFPRPSKRASAALDVNTEAVKRLATVEDHVKERQWAQAILILQQVAADHGDAMIPISSRRYLNVATYCNSILANLPPEGLAVYREKHDAQAKQWLEAGLATRNRMLLEKIPRQAFVSSFGDDALYWLGEWAWDEGNFAAARDSWRQLLELPDPPDAGRPQPVLRYPDSSFSQALVVARIVLCHIMEGDREQAKQWRAYLAKQYPEARGDLAGQSGLYADILAEVLKDSESWQFPASPADMPTFAGNPRRNHVHPTAPEVGGVQWERPLPAHNFDPPSPRGRVEASLSYFPQVVGNTIYFCDPKRIYALDRLTGQPRWPRGETEPANEEDLSAAMIYETSAHVSRSSDFQVGQPRFTLTVHENRLYARMGSPVTGQTSTGTGISENHLVCLDLTKEGKFVWGATPAQVLAGTNIETKRQWAFEGAPVVDGGRVFVALRQSHPQTEAMVACLDAESGRPQWTRRVASALGGLAERQSFVSHHLVTLGENMVFFVPEFGVVSALDAIDGRLVWAVTYPAFAPKDSPIKDPRKQGLTPGVFHQGVLYVAPTDSESVLAISSKTGVILWEREIPYDDEQIRHILGIVKNRLVLSGNHLWILNAHSGAIETPAQLPPDNNPEFDGYGRGIIAGDTIFWPTRSTIELRDLTGQRTKQPEPFPGGNLAVAGDLLLSAEPRRLIAYSNFAQVREKERELISRNPDAALPRWRLAQVEEANGETLAALKLYEEAIAKATPQDKIAGQPLKGLAARNRVRLLLRLGTKALADGLPEQAADYFQEAAGGAETPAARAEALEQLGTAQVQAKRIREAVQTFQSILDNPALANLPVEKNSAATFGEFAKDRIAPLLAKHGREIYAEYDRIASDKIALHLENQNLEGVEGILRQYPNALVTAETRHQLARLKRDRGEVWSAIRIWQELLEAPARATTRQAVLWELARSLEHQGYLRPAAGVWRELALEFPAASLPTEAGSKTAAPYIRDRLRSERYRLLDQSAPALPMLRRWERNLSPEANILIPEGEPPGPRLALVLIDARGLTAVDPSDGETRWEKPLNHPALWAAYGPMQLILGTRESLLASALETGETLWQVSLEDSDDDLGRAPGFRLAGNRVLIRQDQRLTSYDITTGRPVWNQSPPGVLSPLWNADANFTVIQSERPLRVLVFDTKTGRRLSEHRPREPWVSPPIAIESPPPKTLSQTLSNNRGFLSAMTNRRIQAFGAFDPQADPMWTFQGATSFANAPPQFWSQGENLLMLMDGDTLVRLAPDTGETLWFMPIFSTPVSKPDDRLIWEDQRIFIAEDHVLSCLNLADGKSVWKHPLPRAGVWALQKQGPLLFAVPRHSNSSDTHALIFEAQTGAPVQKLQVPPGIIHATFHRAGSFVATKDKLLGWGPLEYSSPAN